MAKIKCESLNLSTLRERASYLGRDNVARSQVVALKAELPGTMKLFWSRIMFELLRQIVTLFFSTFGTKIKLQ